MNEKTKHASLENLATFAEQIAAKYSKKSDIPTKVSALENDSGFQTAEQVTDAINAKVSSVFKPGGSVAFAELPELAEANLGLQELSTSMNAAIHALNSEKVSRTDVETLIQNAIATHNNSDESHSTFLAIR